MPTFFARRYTRKIEAVSNTEKVLGIVILLLVAGIIAAFVVQAATNRDYLFDVDEGSYALATSEGDGVEVETARSPAGEVENPFPDPGLEGWRAPRWADHFTADSLYVKIDGRAEAFLQFGVLGLTFGTYVHQDDTDRTVAVYWYDMGEPGSALGMYRSEETPGATPVAIGRAGYQVGGAVFFCEGSSYVQVLPTRLDDSDARAALKIAECLAERIGEE